MGVLLIKTVLLIVMIIVAIVLCVIGVIVGFNLGVAHRKKIAEAEFGSAEEKARSIVKDAEKAADAKKRELLLEAKEENQKLRADFDAEVKERRNELNRQERRINQKEENLDKKTDNLEKKEQTLSQKLKSLESKEKEIAEHGGEIIHAKGIDIGIYTKDFENEYISLTDIAKYRNDNDPRFVIQNWMRNRNTVEFLAVWEELHNPDFNRVQFEAVRSEAGLNRFVMTPTKWIEQTNAIGIVSKAGRYGGGTYAHSDIAMAFATWISPEFQLYIMKDYRRLKQDENSRFSLDWNLNRALSKVNYRIHTDAVKENLIPPELTPEQIAYTYASEADLLNVALFGQTAKQWKNNNPGKKGNVRDDANLNQLLVLANMESYNAILIEQGKSQSERLILLRNLAIRQMDTLVSINLSAVSALPGGDM